MIPRTRRERRTMNARLALGFAFALIGSGCGNGGTVAKEADPSVARETLKASLEAWKTGEAPKVLAQRTPSIRVADEDWLAGARLQDFRIDDPGRIIGTNLTCKVVLYLKDKRGRSIKKTVLYGIGTDPELTVVRYDGN